MKRLFFVLFAMIVGILSLRAQSAGRPSHEKMQMAKIGFLTSRLHLTTDEAKQFWPVYDAYEKEKHALMKERKLNVSAAKINKADRSEKEALETLKSISAIQQRQFDLHQKYEAEFLKVLPATKVLSLMEAERAFQRHCRQMNNKGSAQAKPSNGSSSAPRD